uniref:Uncharacterized protein n=1 Tax=Rhodnius prolixus TaxID=13249 RepID=T1HJH6_RHOPR
MGTSDAERSGRPVEVTTPEIIDKIHDMVMDDRRVKVREIASAVGISNEWVPSLKQGEGGFGGQGTTRTKENHGYPKERKD